MYNLNDYELDTEKYSVTFRKKYKTSFTIFQSK
jgi:hypothetical protein